jgi:hypothetical protein
LSHKLSTDDLKGEEHKERDMKRVRDMKSKRERKIKIQKRKKNI